MIDKKAKRYGSELPEIYFNQCQQIRSSAISLRLFGKDITTIGRDVMKDEQGDVDTRVEEPQLGDDSTLTAETEDLSLRLGKTRKTNV